MLGERGWADVVTELCAEYPRFPRMTVERMVGRAAERYQDARVTAFVPVLVRRHVREQLRYVEDLPEG